MNYTSRPEPRPWAWVLYAWAAMVGGVGFYLSSGFLMAIPQAFKASC